MTIRVLVADDQAPMCDLVVTWLERENDIQVLGTVGNGKAAVEFVHREKPDVVIMDVKMPVMDGIEATRAIKAFAPDTQVIGITGALSPADRSLMMQAGARSVFDKLQNFATLPDVIRACCVQ